MDAIGTLGHQYLRAEDFGVLPDSPRIACLQGVRDSDLVILIIGGRYGNIQQSGISATHEEFREAKTSKDVIALIEGDIERDNHQKDFLKEVQDWQNGVLTDEFNSVDDLRRKVTSFLHKKELQAARGSIDNSAIVERALEILPNDDSNWSGDEAKLNIAIAGGPETNLLRPAELQNEELDRFLSQVTILGDNAILHRKHGIEVQIVSNSIEAYQQKGGVRLYADGALRIQAPIPRNSHLSAIIEEDVHELLLRALRLALEVYSHIDDTEKLRAFAVACKIENSNHTAWRTRKEEMQNAMSVSMTWGEKAKDPVLLSPPTLSRAKFRATITELSEDFCILLKQQASSSL